MACVKYLPIFTMVRHYERKPKQVAPTVDILQ